MERELIGLGLRLRWLCDGTDRLNWRDLIVIIREASDDSPIARFLLGDNFKWDLHAELLAWAVDAIQAGNWQRAGGRGEKPKPVPRPQHPTSTTTDTTDATEATVFGEGFQMDAGSTDEIDQWLGLSLLAA